MEEKQSLKKKKKEKWFAHSYTTGGNKMASKAQYALCKTLPPYYSGLLIPRGWNLFAV